MGLTHVSPDRQQHALALVIARRVGDGLADVACDDRSVDGRDDLAKVISSGVAGQYVATPDSPFWIGRDRRL